MTNRKLDHYYKHYRTSHIVHIIEAIELENTTEYRIEYSRKDFNVFSRVRNRKLERKIITKEDKWFWSTYKRTSKLKAMLLW